MPSDENFDEAPNLDEVLGRSMSRRARIIRWGVLALTVLVVAAFVIALFGQRLAAVQPTHTTYALHITSNVTWGTITLTRDNHLAVLAPMPELPSFIRLTPGFTPEHISVSVAAAPFTTKRCELTLPPRHDDTCVSLDGADVQTAGRAFTTPDAIALAIHFPFTLDDLAPGKRGDILALVDDELRLTQPRALITLGGHYDTGGIAGKAVMVAPQPLIATLITQRAAITAGSCAICAPNAFSHAYQGSFAVWHVRADVQQTWSFARADDGASVGSAYENNVPHSLDFDLIYDLSSQTWLSSPPAAQLLPLGDAVTHSLCNNGQAYLEELFFQTLQTLAHFDPDPSVVDHGNNGCLFQVVDKDRADHPAAFLWRFGQMYAANDVAQQADASLPVASSQDLASFVG